jgi:hypothetical protein
MATESTIASDTYPSDYKTLTGSRPVVSNTEVFLFMVGPRPFLLDELTFTTDAGTGTLTATLWYAVDGADMDSAASDNVQLNTGTVEIGTAAKDAKKTFTLSSRKEIPAYAKVWIKSSDTWADDQIAWVVRGQER